MFIDFFRKKETPFCPMAPLLREVSYTVNGAVGEELTKYGPSSLNKNWFFT